MWIKFDNVWNTPIAAFPWHLSQFNFPQPQVSSAIIVEFNISDGGTVTVASVHPHDLSLLHGPKLAQSIQSCTQQQVTQLREQ
jgi:hypothetical protein